MPTLYNTDQTCTSRLLANPSKEERTSFFSIQDSEGTCPAPSTQQAQKSWMRQFYAWSPTTPALFDQIVLEAEIFSPKSCHAIVPGTTGFPAIHVLFRCLGDKTRSSKGISECRC